MVYFGSHVLLPLSFAIRIDLLLGNIPACFFELRLILESMVKCFWADIQYKEPDHFMEKLQSLEEEINKSQTSTSKLLDKMGMTILSYGASYPKNGFTLRVSSKKY